MDLLQTKLNENKLTTSTIDTVLPNTIHHLTHVGFLNIQFQIYFPFAVIISFTLLRGFLLDFEAVSIVLIQPQAH